MDDKKIFVLVNFPISDPDRAGKNPVSSFDCKKTTVLVSVSSAQITVKPFRKHICVCVTNAVLLAIWAIIIRTLQYTVCSLCSLQHYEMFSKCRIAAQRLINAMADEKLASLYQLLCRGVKYL